MNDDDFDDDDDDFDDDDDDFDDDDEDDGECAVCGAWFDNFPGGGCYCDGDGECDECGEALEDCDCDDEDEEDVERPMKCGKP